MGNFILGLVDRTNAFILTFMDKIILIIQAITTGGRKMTVTMFTTFCLTLLGVQCIMVLAQIPTIIVLCIAGVAGFFFGINILGDHILNGKNKVPADDQTKDGD